MRHRRLSAAPGALTSSASASQTPRYNGLVNQSEREWIEHDDALRARARELARMTGRDEDDLYRTLRHLERTPSERLELGLRHARLRVHGK